MTIIKQGKIPDTSKKGKCDYCGCIFKAEKGEYKATGQLGVMHDGLPNYNCECPCCGKTVYFD